MSIQLSVITPDANGKTSASTGAFLINTSTFSDDTTAANGTSSFNGFYIPATTLTAKNTGVVTTDAASLTIGGQPTAGTNQTITNAYAILCKGNAAFYGTTIAASAAQSGNTVSTGQFLSVRQPGFTDTTSAASSTNAIAWSADFFAAPVLSASNTGVTYSNNISTVTIAGPPTAGTNVSITGKRYALNIPSGDANIGGNLTAANLPVAQPTPTLTFTALSATTTSVTVSRAALTYDPVRLTNTLTATLAVVSSGDGTCSFNFALPGRTSNFADQLGLQLKGAPYVFDTSPANMVGNLFSVSGATSATGSFYTNTAGTVYFQFDCIYSLQ